MNEQVRLLAEQALQLVADEHTDGDESRLNTDSYHVKDLIQEKLALLIIKKCMNAVGNGPMERASIQAIKAAFGVEYYEPIEKGFGGNNE